MEYFFYIATEKNIFFDYEDPYRNFQLIWLLSLLMQFVIIFFKIFTVCGEVPGNIPPSHVINFWLLIKIWIFSKFERNWGIILFKILTRYREKWTNILDWYKYYDMRNLNLIGYYIHPFELLDLHTLFLLWRWDTS